MIQVSIPGKIHLIGEHSVVYGKTAILASINLFLHAKISKSSSKKVLGLIQFDDAIPNMQKAIEGRILEKFNLEKIPNYKIEIDKSGIPVGSGLGTSASLSAAFTICLLKFLKLPYSQKDIFEIALEGEKIFHGNPSGGDLAMVLNQGLILFKKKKAGFKITPFSVPTRINKFILIDSGKPQERTSEMVQKVSLRAKRSNLNFNKVLDSQESLAKQMTIALKESNEQLFVKIINEAEENLEKMGVVGKLAKSIIKYIQSLEGAAKITGAGGIKKGSGMILAYHKDLNQLIKFAKENDLKYYSVQISNEGVKY